MRFGFVLACANDEVDVVQTLLTHPKTKDLLDSPTAPAPDLSGNVPPPAQSYTGFTVACKAGSINTFKLLIGLPNRNELVSFQDDEKKSGFFYACKYGRSEFVQAMINEDLVSKNEYAKAFLHLCRENTMAGLTYFCSKLVCR